MLTTIIRPTFRAFQMNPFRFQTQVYAQLYRILSIAHAIFCIVGPSSTTFNFLEQFIANNKNLEKNLLSSNYLSLKTMEKLKKMPSKKSFKFSHIPSDFSIFF